MADFNLVYQTAFWGDLLLAIPLLKYMRRMDPERKIVLACRKGFGGFMKDLGLCDEVVEVDKSDSESIQQSTKELKKRQYHWIISPHQSFRTALALRGLKAEIKVGFSDWWNFWAFDKRVNRPQSWPDAVRQLYLATAIDPSLDSRLQRVEPFFTQRAGAAIPEWT